MINLKPQIVAALKADPELLALLGGPNVYFQYPPNPSIFPRVTYYEVGNKPSRIGDEVEYLSEIVMMVDIWHTHGTSDIASAVDNVMAGLGFTREYAADLFENTRIGVIHHKTMRFKIEVEGG